MTTRTRRARHAAATTVLAASLAASASAALAVDPVAVPDLPPPLGATTTTTAAPTTTAPPVAEASTRIYFSRSTPETAPDLWSLDPATVTTADPDGDAHPIARANSEAWDYSAAVSPDGRWLAFVSARDGDDEIFVLDLASDASSPVQLTHNGAPDLRPTWSPDSTMIAYVGWSPIGQGAKELPRVRFMSRSGGAIRVLSDPGSGRHSTPAWSPDGSRVAVAVGSDTDADLAVFDVETGQVLARLTDGPAKEVNWQPDWSPDGTRIVFTRRQFLGGGREDHDLFVINADGTGRRALLEGAETDAEQPDWHPDGRAIAFSGLSRQTRQIHRLAVDATGAAGTPTTVFTSAGYDTQPEWVPAAQD